MIKSMLTAALAATVTIGGMAAVPVLTDRLNDERFEVRRYAFDTRLQPLKASSSP